MLTWTSPGPLQIVVAQVTVRPRSHGYKCRCVQPLIDRLISGIWARARVIRGLARRGRKSAIHAAGDVKNVADLMYTMGAICQSPASRRVHVLENFGMVATALRLSDCRRSDPRQLLR